MTADRESAVVFDVGGVLLAHDNELLFRTLAARCASADADRRVREGLSGLSTGVQSVSDAHRRLSGELAYRGDWEQFKQDWCCHFALDPSMIGLANALAKRNRFLLFSNTNSVHWDFVLAMGGGALAAFESYASHDIGDAKPAESAYNKVASLAGIDPSRSIFVDDFLVHVEGARRAGFNGHQFIDQLKLERFLREAGIIWNT